MKLLLVSQAIYFENVLWVIQPYPNIWSCFMKIHPLVEILGFGFKDVVSSWKDGKVFFASHYVMKIPRVSITCKKKCQESVLIGCIEILHTFLTSKESKDCRPLKIRSIFDRKSLHHDSPKDSADLVPAVVQMSLSSVRQNLRLGEDESWR